MVICHCKALNDAAIKQLIDGTDVTVEDISDRCGAGTDCGSCVAVIEEMLGSTLVSVAGSRSAA